VVRTSDGKHVLAEMSSKEFKYFEVGKSDDAKAVSLAGLQTYRILPLSGARFSPVWRRYRDFFYVENMHGYDWENFAANTNRCSTMSATAPILTT